MATSDDNVIVIADDSDDDIITVEDTLEPGDEDAPPPPAPHSYSHPCPSSSISSQANILTKQQENDGLPEVVIECPICLQTCIHPARLPCGHIFCFLCVKGVAYKNRRCAMCRREIPPEFLDHPQLVNGIQDICKTKTTEDGYQWFYEGRNGGWWAYDPRSILELEEAYHSSSTTNYDILICGSMYTIDFTQMVQFAKDCPHRKRRIQRAKNCPSKGVAGISKNI